MRTIMHVDLDAFYSAIEQRDRPELRGKPVVVGGDPEARGVVATASYEARRFGIHSAMPARTARRLCPQAIFVRPRFDVYRQVSAELRQIFAALTPLVEPLALDEAFLDLSSLLTSPAEAGETARALKQQIRDSVKLTASVGVASNKLIAKVASDREKPDGLTIVPAGEERSFLAPLPVRLLFGIGPRTEERLGAIGIERVGQLADADPGWLVARLGQRGLEWQRLAQGIDDRPVEPQRELKQISRERTFPRDVADRIELRAMLQALAHELVADLQEALPARTVTLKLRHADLRITTRRATPGPVITAELLESQVLQLFEEGWDGRPLRLMGVGVSNFVTEPTGQLSLFN
ncbi:MAG TPA: DNA polymerase IV [Chloroflexota bacterium]|nr:DNA polymerase IV [Chloroflexota bacterium]